MKVTGRIEKWLTVALAAVCLFLVINLVGRLGGTRVGASRPSPNVAPAGAGPGLSAASASGEEFSRHDPAVRLDLLKELQTRRLPELPRNPFEYVIPPAQTQPAAPATTAVDAQPPASPPISLKAVGYAEKAGGVREAYVADQEQLYVVHEGDSLANRYKVLKISPRMIEIEDESLHQTVELPVPQ